MRHEESEPPAAEHRILELTEPSYMAAFSCLGGACPDTCCQRWDIVLDAATCEKYAHSHDADFRHEVAQAIEHRQEDGQEIAVIRLGHGQRCPFLRNDGWCLIQRRTSEYYLSEVCRTYPRVLHVWNETQAERALCVSCIGAAQLILGSDAPLRFVTREMDEAEWAGLRIADRGEKLAPQSLGLRALSIEILQQRRWPLWQRLRLANDFFWAAAGLQGHHAERHFAALAADCRQQLAGPAAAAETVDTAARLELLRRLMVHRLQSRELRGDVRQRIEDALVRWQAAAAAPVSSAAVRLYAQDRELYELEVMPQFGGLAENFLVNGIFADVFVMAADTSFYAGWFRLLLQFVLLRTLLVAAAAAEQAVPPREEAVWLAHLVAQAIGHDALYLAQARSLLAAGGDEAAAVQAFCRVMV